MKNIFSILRLFSKILSVFPNSFLYFLYEINSFSEAKFFIAMRYILIGSIVEAIGDNVYIGKNVTIKNAEKLTLGNNISIHNNCYIDSHGEISIGNNVSIAHNSTILSSSHTWKDLEKPIKYNNTICLPVIIYDNVWIGCGVRILMGVTINSRSIVAANAIVNRDVMSNTLVGGIPIKIIKEI